MIRILSEMKRTGTLRNGDLRNDSIVAYSIFGSDGISALLKIVARVVLIDTNATKSLNQTQRTQADKSVKRMEG